MLQRFSVFTAAALIAAASAAAQTAPRVPKQKHDQNTQEKAHAHLGIGDQAPALSISKWVKGEEVKAFEPGHVYIVEFWATWCPPCRESIPHLNHLQQEFKDQGVTVIGVASSERATTADDKLAGLEKFVKAKGDEMSYRVAFDPERRMGDAYLNAAGKTTIPTAFIIGKDGKIAWIGHPMNGMDAALHTALARAEKKDGEKTKPGAAAGAPALHFAAYQPEQPEKKADKTDKKAENKTKKNADEQPAESGPTIGIGDKAPALTVGKWVKGEPVETLKPGQTYVVEFWATWCVPCKKSIPHLTELQKKYDDKVRFIGVSIWENDQKAVAPFVKEMGDKMAYTVAADDMSNGDGKMAAHWMDAAGQNTIPTAFVINKAGRIAWIGHPNDPNGTLPKVLDKVLAGEWDIDKEAAAQKKQSEIETKLKPAMRKVLLARGTNDADAELAAIDEVLAIDSKATDPDTQMPFPLAARKFVLLLTQKQDYDKAYAYGKEAVDGALKDNAEGLNEVAWTIVDPDGPDLEKRDLDLAMKAAKRAMELTKNEDGMITDTLAKVYHDQGELTKALELQEKAVKLIDEGAFKGSPEARESIKKELQSRLDDYKEEAKKKGS